MEVVNQERATYRNMILHLTTHLPHCVSFVLSSSCRFSDGRIYEGEWVSGRREGYGEMRGRPEDGKHPDEWTFYAGTHRARLK